MSRDLFARKVALRAHVEARIRADGGPLTEVVYLNRDGTRLSYISDPHAAYLFESEVTWNGGTIISVTRVR